MTPLERHADLMAQLLDGKTMAEVARARGITRERVRQIALLYGHTAKTLRPYRTYAPTKSDLRRAESVVHRAEREERKAKLHAEILRLRRQGLQQVEIARLVGCRQTWVSKILIENGLRSVWHKR